MPEQITPDHLTAFGVAGAGLVMTGYIGTRFDPRFLWLAAFGYVIHWLGDSLDGSLARYRNVMRPRYGYFLDHSLDAFSIALMIGGLGFTPYVSMDVALFVVIGYFAMSIHVFLKNAATGTFTLSFMALGPTEFRMVFVAITLWMFIHGAFGANTLVFGYSQYDLTLLVIGLILFGMFIGNTASMALALRAEEGDGRRAMTPEALEQSRKTLNRQRIKDVPSEHLRPAAVRRGY